MIFKLYDCDLGFKRNGVNYDFTDVQSITVDDPEFVRVIRGANGANKTGIVYKEGTSEPKTITVPILNMTAELKAVLDDVYEARERIDFYCVARADGSSIFAKQSVLCQAPKQLSVEDGPDSMQVQLMFQTFDYKEDHRS